MITQLQELTDDELIGRFSIAAKEMGTAVLNSEARRANRIFDRMEAIDRVLRMRGRDARLKLAPLLNEPDRIVRYYAAQYLLGLLYDRARPIIEWNAKFGCDALAGDAGMTLYNLDIGVYKPD